MWIGEDGCPTTGAEATALSIAERTSEDRHRVWSRVCDRGEV